MPSPYTIPTALPFDRLASAGNPYQATTPGQLGELYNSGQGAAAAINQANYGNTTTGYENILAAQKAAQDQTHADYGRLSSDVLGDLSMAGTTQRQNIADQYARSSGDLSQSMISSGLNNSTVQGSMQRGLLYDRMKADNDVMERVGNLKAGYRTQIGQAGLGFDERATGANTGLGLNELGMMERVNAPYPSGAAYGDVARMMGATAQQNADRAAMNRAAAAANAAANRPTGAPIMPGGGSGFFRQPNPEGGGGSGYSGQPLGYGVPPRPTYPGVPDSGPGNAGMGKGPGAATGVAPGYEKPTAESYGGLGGGAMFGLLGDQAGMFGSGAGRGYSENYENAGSGYDLRGEDSPYGQYDPGWGNNGTGFGSYGPQASAAADPSVSFYFGDSDYA